MNLFDAPNRSPEGQAPHARPQENAPRVPVPPDALFILPVRNIVLFPGLVAGGDVERQD